MYLTGEFATEVSDASGMQLSRRTKDVSGLMKSSKSLILTRVLLAKVYESPEVTGTILPEIAEEDRPFYFYGCSRRCR